MMMRTRGAAVAVVALMILDLAPAAPAFANPLASDGAIQIAAVSAGKVTRTAQVRTSDLDLSDQAGRRRLGYRIEYASERVCQPDGAVGLHVRADVQTCMQGARRSGWSEAARLARVSKPHNRDLALR